MNRRKFLTKSLLGAGIIGFGGGYWWLNSGPGKEAMSMNDTIRFLQGLDLNAIHRQGSWSVAQVFTHLAQSIEMSMDGYPQHKSDTFKNTLGSLAFKAFSQRGEMMHPLDDVIPGAPELIEMDRFQAHERLLNSLLKFQNFNSVLQPHFAYGPLTKQQYSWAHIMHIENHFQELKLGSG